MLISGACPGFRSGSVAIPLGFCKPLLWWLLKYYANINLPWFAISCEVSTTEPASHLERSKTQRKLLMQRSQDTFSFRLFFCFNPKIAISSMFLIFFGRGHWNTSSKPRWGQVSAQAHVNNLCKTIYSRTSWIHKNKSHVVFQRPECYLHMAQDAASPALSWNTWNNCFKKAHRERLQNWALKSEHRVCQNYNSFLPSRKLAQGWCLFPCSPTDRNSYPALSYLELLLWKMLHDFPTASRLSPR